MAPPAPAKKLIEVALPLDAINAACIREKSLRHGHPSTLHLYWARRPLAAMRAVLFAQLVDDPSAHPDRFPTEEAQTAERKRLFGIIEELVQWKSTTDESVLNRARAEIRRCCPDVPTICDPFSGGGTTALEAQRLGLPVQASDLNPVSVIIGKAMVDIPARFAGRPPVHPGTPDRQFYRHAEGLAEDVACYGHWMRDQAMRKIGHLYPPANTPDHGPRTPIAWIWARTVPSPDPAWADVPVPLVTSFMLSAKKGREVWIEPVVDRAARTLSWAIRHGGTAEELARARQGTSAGKRQGFRCIFTGAAVPYAHIKASGRAGKLGTTLMAIVAEGDRGRLYLPPNAAHRAAAEAAQPEWQPEELIVPHPQYMLTVAYGMETFGDLFTPRQLTALTTFSALLPEVRRKIELDAARAARYSEQDRTGQDRTGQDRTLWY